jgi:hypothetical protein
MKKMKYLGEGIAKYVKRRITQSTAPRKSQNLPFSQLITRIHDCPGCALPPGRSQGMLVACA